MANIREIEMCDISLAYGSNPPLLRKAAARFSAGILYIVKGRSGIGKTSLLSLIGLLEKPSAGEILYDGKSVPLNKREEFRKKHVSFLFQDLLVFPSLSGLENLSLAGASEEETREMAARLGLDPVLSSPAGTYSKGETMRLAVGRSLLEGKDIVLLDEPTGNLDEDNRKMIGLVLEEEARQRIIVAVSHDLEPDGGRTQFVAIEEGKLVTMSGRKAPSTGREAEAKGRFPRTLKRKPFFEIFADGLRKIPFKTAFFCLVFAFLGFLTSTTLSFASYDPATILRDRYEELGLLSLSVSSNEPPPGAFLLKGAYVEQGGVTANVNYLYGEGSYLFYGETPVGNEVLVPDRCLYYYGLREGKAVLQGQEVELVAVPLEVGVCAAYKSYFGDGYEEELAYALPFQVGSGFVSALFREQGIEVETSLFAPFLVDVGLTGNPLLRCVILASDCATARVGFPSYFNDDPAIITNLLDKGLEVMTPEEGRGFRLDRLSGHIEVGEAYFDDGNALTVELPKELSEEILADAYGLGLLGSAGTYVYGSREADYCLALSSPIRVYGFSPEQFDFLSASYEAASIFATPLLAIVLFFDFAGAYLAVYELYRIYFRPGALLSLIGYRRVDIDRLAFLYLLVFLIVPFLIGSLLLFSLLSGEVNSLLAAILARNPLFSMVPMTPWALAIGAMLPFLFLTFVPIFFKEGKSFLRLVKKDRE